MKNLKIISVNFYFFKISGDIAFRFQFLYTNPFSANPTKWANTLKKFLR